MNNMRIIVGAVCGAFAATLLAWGGLYLFGATILHGQGSLFDSSPRTANFFFAGWLGLTVIAALTGGYMGKSQARRPRN